jgi:hypothetical protein
MRVERLTRGNAVIISRYSGLHSERREVSVFTVGDGDFKGDETGIETAVGSSWRQLLVGICNFGSVRRVDFGGGKDNSVGEGIGERRRLSKVGAMLSLLTWLILLFRMNFGVSSTAGTGYVDLHVLALILLLSPVRVTMAVIKESGPIEKYRSFVESSE